jgi:AAHS family 4-hydroxybenzoate transporter-like MFS transporter
MAGTDRTVDVAALLDERRLSPFNYRLIVLSWLITLFDGLDMTMISFTAPYMRDDLHLDNYMLGNLFSAGTAGMVIGGLILASLGDRIGRRPTILLAAFTFGFLTIATGFATSYHALLVLRFLDGVATGGMLPLAWALNIEFVPRRMRATVVTVIMVGYSAGGVASGPMTNLIAPHFGWEGVYIAGGIATLACSVLLWMGLPESVRFLVNKGKKPEAVVQTLLRIDPGFDVAPDDHFLLGDEIKASRRVRLADLFRGDLAILTPLLWLGYGASSLAIYFASSWGPLLLEDLKVARETAALVTALSGLLGAVAGLLLMRFTDRLGPRAVAFYPALAVPVLLWLGLGYAPPGLLLSTVVLASLLVGGEHSGIISIAAIFYPSAIRATGAGWASSIGKAGGVLGPILGAVALSSGMPVIRSYALLAVCPAILCLCALGIAITVKRRAGVPGVPQPA